MQTFNEWLQNKLDKYHEIRLAKVMPSALASQIFDKMTPNEVFPADQLILYIKENVGVEDINLIQEAIEILVDQQRLIAVEKNGVTYYRKMQI